MASNTLPSDLVWAFAVTIVFSLVCLIPCAMLLCLQWKQGDRFSYVSLLTLLAIIGTASSIADQIYYYYNWRNIQIAQYDLAVASARDSVASFISAPTLTDRVLYWIRYVCYNSESLLGILWAAALFRSTWRTSNNLAKSTEYRLIVASKVFAIAFPALFLGVANTYKVRRHIFWYLFMINAIIVFSLGCGLLLFVLIIFKYIMTRRTLADGKVRCSLATTLPRGSLSEDSLDVVNESSSRFSITNKPLLIRFCIVIIALIGFQARMITFQVGLMITTNRIASRNSPDFSYSNGKTYILDYMPGCVVALAVFLVFGTAKPWRQYVDMFMCRRNKPHMSNIPQRKGSGMLGSASCFEVSISNASNTPDWDLETKHVNGDADSIFAWGSTRYKGLSKDPDSAWEMPRTSRTDTIILPKAAYIRGASHNGAQKETV